MDEPTPRAGRKATRELKALGASLAVVALQRLADPKVRAQIAAQGKVVAGNVRAWRDERADARMAAGGPRTVADRFGRRKLERRVARLRSSVLALGEGRTELAGSLEPVLVGLEEVSDALEVAAGFPLPKRARAHLRVAAVLDQLESALFEAALPQPRA